MSDSPMQFVHPEFAMALWVWVGVLIALVLLERRGSDALNRLVSPEMQDRLVDRPSRWRRWTRVVLLGMSGFSMIIALMQPQWGSRFVATPRVGAEIMIALDVSRSMLADDAKPTRLERAKAEISDLLSYLDNDYVGLIAFAGRATVLSPMTPDKSFLRLALESAGPHVVSRGGTNLAEPILRAVAGMGRPGPAQRALILITDGEDHDSFAMDAARAAAEAGIKIITIGFGDEAGSQIYLRDPKTGARSLLRDADGRAVVSRLNGDLLREIALATDGAFVPAGTGVLDLASIYDAHIAQLTRGQLDDRGRTIRDEAFQFFVLIAIVCLVAAVSIASARGRHASRVIPFAMAIVMFSIAAIPVKAQTETTISGVLNGSDDSGDSKGSSGSNAAERDPRTTFNEANGKLEAGDPVAATALLRAARRDATDDVLLRYAATYNLGMAATARADALESGNAPEALAALYEAADWFREAVVARPDDPDPRHNLDVTLRRALILSDEIAREKEQDLDAELDEMIEAQRKRVAESAVLLEEVVRSGELTAAEGLRSAFRDSATQQRLILADADALGERVAREREQLAAVAEQDRSPEDVLRIAQLEGLLVHLDSAIERMGQTRRQLRQRRAERAYRRGSSALGDLKRARDQLRDMVSQIDILLAEVGRLAGATSALARAGLSLDPAAGTTLPTNLPAFLTRESVEADSAQIEARVVELAARLALAAEQAMQSTNFSGPSPASPGTSFPGETGGAGAANQDARAIAFQEAAPLVAEASGAMKRVTSMIREGRYDLALLDEGNAGEALSAAQERFFDLRRLLNVTYSDEEQIAKISSTDDPALAEEAGEYAVHLGEIQSRNSLRGLRLKNLLDEEKNQRIASLEAEAASDTGPSEESSGDPIESEQRRFELADQLLALAADAMRETTDALSHGVGEGAPDWPRVSEAAARATGHLDAIRTLFFSIAEHVRKLTQDQLDVRDRTQDMVALSVAESSPSHEAAEIGGTGASEAASSSQSPPEPRGAETQALALELAGDQQKLESRGGEIADALFVQAEEMGQGTTEDAGPDPTAERDRIRKAAEHVASAQLAMKNASESLEAESAPLAPVQDAQTLAVDELKAALALLSPPPPPSDESNPEQDQGRSQSNDESQEDGAQNTPGGDGSEGADEESMGDPSQLLQGVRDRDAERRRERDREEQRRRAEPVDKDW